MESRDRDKFYSSSQDDDDDGSDYELEPPDADVLAAEVQRAKDAIEASNASIDIDEIYRDAGRQRSDEIVEQWVHHVRQGFRFQVKHLLVGTAVLAIVLTLAKFLGFGTVVVLLIMFSIAGVYFYFQWQEKKAEEEAHRRRQEMYDRKRAHFEKTTGKGGADSTSIYTAEPESVAHPLPNDTDQAWQEAMSQQSFSFRFSMAELMVAMTTAAIIFGLVHLGGASNAATLLGFVALIGLIVHALGFDPPNIVVLGWWMILVLYVMLSVAAALWRNFA